MTTNYERIKQRSVEEMASELVCLEGTCGRCDFCIHWHKTKNNPRSFDCDATSDEECIEGIKQWLESEAKDG